MIAMSDFSSRLSHHKLIQSVDILSCEHAKTNHVQNKLSSFWFSARKFWIFMNSEDISEAKFQRDHENMLIR